jgi:thiamine phosphate synthase YjbQ (UPF0047 family)
MVFFVLLCGNFRHIREVIVLCEHAFSKGMFILQTRLVEGSWQRILYQRRNVKKQNKLKLAEAKS